MHEKADILITQHTMHIAKKYTEPMVCVMCDDTDVYALLYQCSLTMQSPIHGRSCIDIKGTTLKHAKITPYLLALHALIGCDTVAATYGIGEKNYCGSLKGTYTGPAWTPNH